MKYFLFILSLLLGFSSSEAQVTEWILQNSGVSDDLLDVEFLDLDTAFACGTGGTVVRSTNGAIDWVSLPAGDLIDFRSLSFVDNTNGYAGGDQAGLLDMAKTHNGGDSWSSVSTSGLSSSRLEGLSFIAVDTGWMFNLQNEVYYKAGDDNDWVQELIDLGGQAVSSMELWEIATTPSGNAFIAGQIDPDGSEQMGIVLQRKTDGGVKWQPQSDAAAFAGNIVRSIHLFGETLGFAGGNNAIYKTTQTDQNTGWRKVVTPDGIGRVFSISFGSASVGWAVAENRVVLETTDGGETWQQQILEGTGELRAVSALDAKNVLIVGDGGAIYKADVSAGVKPVNQLKRVSAFPNPVAGDFTLSMDLEKTTNLTIDLINSLGQQLHQLYRGPVPVGESIFQFGQLNSLPGGLYYLRLRSTDGGIATISLRKE